MVSEGEAPLMTVNEVAALLRLHPRTVRYMAREGRLPGIAVTQGAERNHWRFRRGEIQRWLEAGR